jgi:hypothetical protein
LASRYPDFLCEELLDFVKKGFWMVLPYPLIKKHKHLIRNLRISPMGAVYPTMKPLVGGGAQGASQGTNSCLQLKVDTVLLPCGGLPRKRVFHKLNPSNHYSNGCASQAVCAGSPLTYLLSCSLVRQSFLEDTHLLQSYPVIHINPLIVLAFYLRYHITAIRTIS